MVRSNAVEIVVPRLGWSMDEGTFVEWLKEDGGQVEVGDMLFVLESEKAAQEVESQSPTAGAKPTATAKSPETKIKPKEAPSNAKK